MNRLNEQIEYWKKSADQDWKTAAGLFRIKRYSPCLFFCHLTIEKLLKGIIVRNTNNAAPYIHNLEILATLANLELSREQIKIYE